MQVSLRRAGLVIKVATTFFPGLRILERVEEVSIVRTRVKLQKKDDPHQPTIVPKDAQENGQQIPLPVEERKEERNQMSTMTMLTMMMELCHLIRQMQLNAQSKRNPKKAIEKQKRRRIRNRRQVKKSPVETKLGG